MKRLVSGLAGIGVLIIIFGTIYVVVQQAQRSDANSPQIQMAEDAAAQINSSHDPHAASTLTPVDIGKSLAPFTIVYDKSGHMVSGSGYLNGKVPAVSKDMLEAANGKTYSAVTWEPQGGVRIAAVTVAAKDYYVLSGRSLEEVEKNENHTFQLALLGGLASLLLIGAVITARLLGFEPQ